MNNKKSFWSSLPGVLTGLSMLITAIGGLLVTLYALGILPVEQDTKDKRSAIVEVLRQNAQGWNTHDVDMVMSTWHKHASQIMAGGRKKQTWAEYKSGLLPRIQYKYRNIRYIEYTNLEFQDNSADLDCIIKMDIRDHPEGNWKIDTTISMHFEFIKSDDKWYLWSQSY